MQVQRRFLRTLALSALAIAGLGLSAQAQAPLDVRIALVIGNSAYDGAPLVNPVNDAREMGNTLRGLGFTVVELRDAQKAQMTDAIANVRESLKGKQGVGMLYYAGHGLQLDWRNYMVPVDAKMNKAADVPDQTVDINSVIDAFKSAGNRMNILVLDACRDNPFAGTATSKGLAQLDAPPGTFLAYATAPGNVADDGDAQSGNGLYTQYLLEELKKPVAKIEDVFKRVRFHVRQKSQGRQIPWESTSLEDDFYFHNPGKVRAAAPDAKAREEAFEVEKAAWDKIKLSTRADDFYAFLQTYPTGPISEAAQSRLQTLAKAQVVAAPTQALHDKPVVLPNDRFQLGDKFHLVQRHAVTQAEMRRMTLAVTSIKDDMVEVNQGAYLFTSTGGTSRVSLGGTFVVNFDPPMMNFPAGDMQLGKKWHTRTTMALPWPFGKGWIDLSLETVARETVQVEAGSFDTFKTEVRGSAFDGTTIEVTYWTDPAFGYPVKMLWTERKNARVTKTYTHEWSQLPERSTVARQ